MKYTYALVIAVAASMQLFAKVRQSPAPSHCSNLRYWADASFTYWFAKEDGLNVAESAQVNGAATTVFASSPKVFQQKFGYHPGFKVGLGISSSEDWKVNAEYTYYRGENKTSKSAPAGTIGTGVWNLDSWYLQETFFSQQSLTGTKLSSVWKLAMDMGDLLLSYPLKKEAGFVFAPFGGLRTIWIRQQMNLQLNVAGASFGGSSFLGSQPVASHNRSHVWGIGPRIGVDGRYNLPMGFNFDGTIGTTLFVNWFRIKHREAAAVIYYGTPAPLHMSYNCVRPEVDVSLGFGWKKDIGHRQHLELMASYDFTYFWGQNMMRSLMDEYVAGVSSGSLDLYFQGVTFKVAYSF
jgi:hypothetical protein